MTPNLTRRIAIATLSQSVSAAGLSASFASNVTAGDLILAVLAYESGTPKLTPSTDVFTGDSKITAVGPIVGNGVSLLVEYWIARRTGPLSVVASGVTGASVALLEIAPASNGYTSNLFGVVGSSSSTGTGTSADGGSVSTRGNVSGLTVVSVAALAAAATLTPQSGYTAGPVQAAVSGTAGNSGTCSQYQFNVNGTSVDSALGLSASVAWAAATLVFTDNGTAPLPGPTDPNNAVQFA